MIEPRRAWSVCATFARLADSLGSCMSVNVPKLDLESVKMDLNCSGGVFVFLPPLTLFPLHTRKTDGVQSCSKTEDLNKQWRLCLGGRRSDAPPVPGACCIQSRVNQVNCLWKSEIKHCHSKINLQKHIRRQESPGDLILCRSPRFSIKHTLAK